MQLKMKTVLVVLGAVAILVMVLLTIFRMPPLAMQAEPMADKPMTRKTMANPNYSSVTVFYGTNRKPTNDESPNTFFGTARGSIAYGVTNVSIPRDHKMANLEEPSIWKLEWNENPERHVVLMNVTPESESEFRTDLRESVGKSNQKAAFVFVHGFNVSFKDAARRTGQLAYDLNFDGVPLFFSWPSQESLSKGGYLADIQTAEWAAPDLAKFLTMIRDDSGATRIHLIAHSMGNRVLTKALERLSTEQTEERISFNQIVLTAPDIDAEVFERDLAPKIVPQAQRVTLYASREDLAMSKAKEYAADYRRAGDSNPIPLIVPGVESVDASAVDTSFVGHSYYGDNRSVLTDLFDLIRHGKGANERLLKPMSVEKGVYWLFKP